MLFLKPEDFTKLLARDSDPAEDEMLAGLKRAAYHIIHDTLVATTNADVDGLDDRHRSIYDRMQAQDQRASRNELAPKSARWSKASAGVKQLLYDNVSSASVNGRLLVRIGKALLPIPRREISPTELMLSEQLLYTYYEKALRVDRVPSQIAQLLQISAHHNPRATVLEIGAGTDFSGVSRPIRKWFTAWDDLISYTELDIEQGTQEQVARDGSIDLVIASQALHKTRNIGRALTDVRRLLKPGGTLIMVETTQDTLDAQMIFGTLPEWGPSEEKERVSSPHLACQQ